LDNVATYHHTVTAIVQFVVTMHTAREMLTKEGYRDIIMLQVKQLSASEILGAPPP